MSSKLFGYFYECVRKLAITKLKLWQIIPVCLLKNYYSNASFSSGFLDFNGQTGLNLSPSPAKLVFSWSSSWKEAQTL